MSNAVIAFLMAAGFGGWVYSKIMRTTGNNTQTSLIVVAIAFVFTFAIGFCLLGLIPGN